MRGLILPRGESPGTVFETGLTKYYVPAFIEAD